MKYGMGHGSEENWIICEDLFSEFQLGKCESIFYLGNGYMGVRSATEESYLKEQRGTFISGTFNKFDDREVTELPNVPDITNINIVIDNERLDLGKMEFKDYSRTLNLKTGVLKRTFIVTTKKGKEVTFLFERIVSMADLHTIAQKVSIVSNQDIVINIVSGINGVVSNSGFQHFSVEGKRFFDHKILQANFITTESRICFSINTIHKLDIDGEEIKQYGKPEMAARTIKMNYCVELKAEQKFALDKISNIFTSRDVQVEGMDTDTLYEHGKEELKKQSKKGFSRLQKESSEAWQKKIWKKQDIKIQSSDSFDQLAIRFAVFHLAMMTPAHDNRMNIGAKALSGEGYKGHTFWDTEIFLLPAWIYGNPHIARSLLEYRYLCLDGARRKAKENGYDGAMYPWESAWITDGEVTPKTGAADIVTGKAMPIICGDIEQHITCDVAYGVWEYYQITNDEDFMNHCGYEIIFETAKFWKSRLEWNGILERYEILDVIGPDEYSEHVNNNAFTNYMAHWNIELAISYYDKLKSGFPDLFKQLSGSLELDKYILLWKNTRNRIYLPKPNKKLIVPQDDTYLTLPVIELKKYKESSTRADIIKDYNMEQIAHLQVSKQADILVLFYIMEHLFEYPVKKENFYYYEDKCLHDSSLSYSTHSIIASDLEENDLAYYFYQRAARLDLGEDMNSPTDGIHAASMGGIWQCVINGFAGVRMVNGRLRIEPKLPKGWDKIEFCIFWKGIQLRIKAGKHEMKISAINVSETVEFYSYGKAYKAAEEITVLY